MDFNGSPDNVVRKHIDVRIHGFFPFRNSNLKNELRLPEQRIQHFLRTDHIRLTKIFDTRGAIPRGIGEDVTKPTTSLQRISTKREREVIDQKRPVRDAQTVIKPD